MDSITVTTPGKLMLMGEHAVVFGHPCLVTAIDRRLQVSIRRTPGAGVSVNSPQTDDHRFVDAAIAEVRRRWNIPTDGLIISTQSTFTGNYGFGSSSAVTVGVVAALTRLFALSAAPRDVFDAAYAAVLAVQGVGSGFDVAAATYGGTLVYGQGGAIMEQLNLPEDFGLVVGYTGQKADTSSLVRQVKQKYEQHPESVGRIFAAIARLVRQGQERLGERDWEQLGKLMDFNQEYLRDLGVSSEKLETLIVAAKQAGAYGAKLSGAGGGDCMIALVSAADRQAVADAIIKAGGEVIPVSPNAPGISVPTTDDQEEEFVVVDERDEIVGYRTRRDCHSDRSLIHRAIGLLIFDKDGRVLLQQRSLSKDTSPGYWSDSVGGHVMRGETYEQAMLRETSEELGLTVPVTFHSKFVFPYSRETEMNVLFTAVSNGPFTPNPVEVEQVRFFSKDELAGCLLSGEVRLTEFAREALRRVGFIA